MAIVIDILSMRNDLKAFAKAAKTFLVNPQRLRELESQLSNAAAAAKLGDRELRWSTEFGDGGPVQTVASSDYRSSGGQRAIVAEISFSFRGSLQADDDTKLIVRSGGTKVKLRWEGTDGQTLYHFDIHPNAAGHPMLHVQFDSAISEVPRLHSLLAHPLDVLDFALLEVFQTKWKELRADTTFVNAIHKFPSNQRKRMTALLASYSSWINSTDHALIALQKTPAVPLELYPVS